jgi:sulfate transport system permease protein
LGANRWQIVSRIIFPILLPALLTGFALAFARGVGEYGSVIFIAGNQPFKTEIAPLMIISRLEEYDYRCDHNCSRHVSHFICYLIAD